MISQGRIAEIFNGKPADRRAIETAAGVSNINKIRQPLKNAWIRRENLNRVNDIVAELEDQLEPLAEQSALAQDYLEQKASSICLTRRGPSVAGFKSGYTKTDYCQAGKAQTMAAEYDEQAKVAAQTLSQQQAQQNGC